MGTNGTAQGVYHRDDRSFLELFLKENVTMRTLELSLHTFVDTAVLVSRVCARSKDTKAPDGV